MCDNCSSKCSTKTGEEFTLPKITSAFLILTERCNLGCVYCFVNQKPKDITLKVAMDSINFLIKNAEKTGDVPSVNFFGGEPLLKWNEIIVPIVKYIREEYKKPFSLNMTTNGVLLDEEKMKFAKEYGLGVLFSIDGDKCTQDTNRPFHGGKGSFEVLEKVIDLVLKYDSNSTFRATINNNTSKHFSHNFKFAIDKGYKEIFFIPNVFAKWTKEEKETLKFESRMVSNIYIDCFRRGEIVHFKPLDKKIRLIPQINHAILNNKYRDYSIDIGYNKCGIGCGKHASIGTDGKIYGCQEMVSDPSKDNIFEIGNIYEEVTDKQRMNLINKFDIMKVRGLSCKSCKLNRVCDGNCVANNYIENKDLNHMTHILCFWYQILLEEAIYISNTLGSEGNLFFKKEFFSTKSKECSEGDASE